MREVWDRENERKEELIREECDILHAVIVIILNRGAMHTE